MVEFIGPEDRVIRSPIQIVDTKVTDKVTDQVNDQVNVSISNMSNKVLKILFKTPSITVTELSERLSLSRKSVAQKIKELKDHGYIERVGSSRKDYWKITKH